MSDNESDSDIVSNESDGDEESDIESVDGYLGAPSQTANPNLGFDMENDDIDDDDSNKKNVLDVQSSDLSDEESDEESLQKMRKLKDTLNNYHSEHNFLSFDEIKPLTIVRRNNKNLIIDDNHKTTPILTKYEYTRIIGLRTVQLENGLKPLITVDSNIIDPYIIAQMELKERKLPFILKRPIPNGKFEYWPVDELEILV